MFLLPCTALAQDTFDPLPSTAEVDGETVNGILIDEKTAEELFLLRSEVAALNIELDATELRLTKQLEIEKMTAEALRVHHEREMLAMQTYYMGLLEDSSKRTFREKHGFDVGIAVGVLGTVAAIAVTGYALGQTSSL
jgi:hypothetical protein